MWKLPVGRLEKITVTSQSASAPVLKKRQYNINIACVNVKTLPKVKKKKR